MKRIKYSRWDGTQKWLDLDDESLAGRLFEELSHYMNWSLSAQEAMEGLLRQGIQLPEFNMVVMGTDELLQELRQQRQSAFQEFNFNGALDDIKEKINHIVERELKTARTEPGSIPPESPRREASLRGRGLIRFPVPRASPGSTVRPVYDATNEHRLNAVFVEDVVSPVENRIGEENSGGKYATSLLQYERGDALLIGQFSRLLRDLAALTREADPSPPARRALAQHQIDWEIGRLLTLRVVSLHAKGQLPDRESSQAKLFMSEAFQRLGVTAQGIAGEFGNLTHEDGQSLLGGRVVQALVGATTATIIAGTSEIQRTIIATRGLGLPR